MRTKFVNISPKNVTDKKGRPFFIKYAYLKILARDVFRRMLMLLLQTLNNPKSTSLFSKMNKNRISRPTGTESLIFAMK